MKWRNVFFRSAFFLLSLLWEMRVKYWVISPAYLYLLAAFMIILTPIGSAKATSNKSTTILMSRDRVLGRFRSYQEDNSIDILLSEGFELTT